VHPACARHDSTVTNSNLPQYTQLLPELNLEKGCGRLSIGGLN